MKERTASKSIVMNDPVHGLIELDSLCVKIIDTPQFQRLRHLHQCGSAHYVYPGARHTRFEHCIGVCHLAEAMARVLQRKQPELNITDRDVQCVAIAGLCHDLGHGPFSHLFDSGVLPHFDKSWQHEHGSIDMFDYLIEDNNLASFFRPEDLLFIKELIFPYEFKDGEEWPFKGRGRDKEFLYEIVANKKTGMDVDKWDYIMRDCYFMGIKTAFDHTRLLKFVRVLDVEGEQRICLRDKEVDNLYELFHSRTRIYIQAYLHKTVLIAGHMICQALIAANDYIFIEGDNGKKYKMSETVRDMTAYVKLTEEVFFRILYSTDENLKPARTWLDRLTRRRLPKAVGIFSHNDDRDLSSADRIKNQLLDQADALAIDLQPSDVIVIKSKWDYGMNTEDPVRHTWFFNKDDPNVPYKPRRILESNFLPKKFREIRYLVFCSDESPARVASVKRCYESLCVKRDVVVNEDFSCSPVKHSM